MESSRCDRLYLSPPHMSGLELEFVGDAFKSNYIAPLGPMVDAFEQEFAQYVGIEHCLAVTSGTAAMHLALRELGVRPGDVVLSSTLTFIGGITPAMFQGASPIFIDSDFESWCLDPGLLAEELAFGAKTAGQMPKAVIVTDLYGQCADLNRIRAVCEPYGVPVVADSAEAMGAFYREPQQSARKPGPARLWLPDPGLEPPRIRAGPWRHAGCGARAAVYSFNGNKIITTSGGGMLASEDQKLIEHARKLSQQARDAAPHYEHSEIGYNYRMSNILAAIGRAQLRVLEERVAAKRRVFEAYCQLLADLPGLQFMPEAPGRRSNRWLTVVLIDPAEFGVTGAQVRVALEAQNIESRPVWKPMHLQPVFQGCRIRGGSVSELLFRCGLCLPSGTSMTDSDLERVARVVRRCHLRSGQPVSSPAPCPKDLPRPQLPGCETPPPAPEQPALAPVTAKVQP